MRKRWFEALMAFALVLAMLCPAAAGADAADGAVEYEVVETTSYAGGDLDSNDMLQAYIDALSDYAVPKPRSVANMGAKLTGYTGAVYRKLLPLLEQVAAGQLDTAVFEFTFEELGMQTKFTAQELGLSVVAENGSLTQAAKDAINARTSVTLSDILNALMADCPYVLYWYDKTTGVGNSKRMGFWPNGSYAECEGSYIFQFAVSSDYAGSEPYIIDTGKTAAVQQVISRAASIVAQYAGSSDYDKLVGYRNEICNLASYNKAAASNSATLYGNPWQMIWVFDDDPNTTVVCEGYAKAFQYLCDLTSFHDDITCISVTGDMSSAGNSGGHMWNLVRMPNNKVYLVDVTNCDTGTVGAPDQLFLVGYSSINPEPYYKYTIYCNSDSIHYNYDSKTTSTYSAVQLDLSGTNYASDDQTAVYNSGWEYENGVITKYTGPGGDVTVPGTIDGHAVTAIGNMAFRFCQGVTSVVIPEGVTSIGELAFFDCANLVSVTIPDSVTSMGDNAFTGCGSLNAIYCGANSYARQWAMENDLGDLIRGDDPYVASGDCGDNLTWTLDENGLLTISGTGAMTDFLYDGMPWYDYHDAITGISLPEGLTRIGSWAFEFSRNLTSVEIPQGVTSIGTGAFINNTQLSNVTLPETLSSIEDTAFAGCTALTSVTLPASVTSIAADAFSGSGLNAIYCYRTSYARQWATNNGYGDIVNIIDPYVASGDCGDNLTWTLDENGLLTISGTGAMTDYDSFSEVPWYDYQSQITAVDIQNGVTRIGNRAFMFANLTSVVIPASVTEIGGMVFYHCGSLTSVSIPENVTEIGWSCFEGCSGLTSLTLPDGITFLGVSAFEGCAGLASVNIPTGLDDINSNLFSQCTSLSSITIPESVWVISSGAFMDCANLTDVFLPATVTHIEDNAFDNCPNLRIHCPFGSYAASWALDNDIPVVYILPEGIVDTGICGAEGDNLTWTLDGNGLLTISGAGDMKSFFDAAQPWYDYNIQSVVISEGVTSIGIGAFREASSLTDVVLPDSLTSISELAFYDCNQLTRINIPYGVTSIGYEAFVRCYALTDIVIPDGVTEIAPYTFGGCTGLTDILIPDSVTSVGDWAFEGCAGLTSFAFPDSVTHIGHNVFANCANLTKIVLPENLAGIEDDAFNGWPHADDGVIYAARTDVTGAFAVNHPELTVVFFDEAWDEPTYEWAADHRSVTATRVGLFDDSMVETETTTDIAMALVEEPTETAMGRTSYRAHFENDAFDTACDAADIPALSELNVLRLPASLTEIEAEAFMGGSFDAVILPEGCESIGEYAFANCPNLIFAHVPMGTAFEENAFDGCGNFRWPVPELKPENQ